MKKKINNLIAAFLVMAVGVMGIGTVYADDANGTPSAGGTPSTNTPSTGDTTAAVSNLTVSCTSTELAVGGSTLCTVKFTPNAALANSTSPTKNVTINMTQSKYLTVSEVKEASGFIIDSSNVESNKDNGTITLTYAGTLTAGKEIEILSFNLKLEEAAANITNGDCGRMCVSGVVFDTQSSKAGSIKVGDDGKYCPNITIVKKNCKDEECNPTTGEFMNYAIIAGVASVALVSIALISKKKKFYTV